jgi:sensor histidine kinase regulating citrate/malate metabolism
MDKAQQIANKTQLLELLNQIQSQHGPIILVLIVIIFVGCGVFWILIWRVWSAAMKAKDDEISRLAKESDKYQSLVFQRLKTSENAVAKAKNTGRKSGKGT